MATREGEIKKSVTPTGSTPCTYLIHQSPPQIPLTAAFQETIRGSVLLLSSYKQGRNRLSTQYYFQELFSQKAGVLLEII